MNPDLHVLACAYAARPNAGSESYVGWAGLLAISQFCRVTAIVHGHNRSEIEPALPSLPQRENLRFHYLGETQNWHPNRMIARFQDWSWVTAWTKKAHELAKDLSAKERFDLAHHLTIATWRLPSPLADLGLPLVWGPIGGAESFPPSFYSVLSPVARGFELLRWSGNHITLRSRRMRRFASEVSVALGNNRETITALGQLGIPYNRTKYLSQSFLPAGKFLSLEELNEKWSKAKQSSGDIQGYKKKLKIFAGGNLEGRKGVAIALQALVRLGRSGIPFSFSFGGLGPELGHLQRSVAKMNFGSGTVSLGHHFSGDEYRRHLAEADVYLLPSLREGAPVTMIEAMACGAVPVVADAGGAPMVVDSSCGFVVPVTSPDQMAFDICSCLESLASDPPRLEALSRAAWARAKERCTERAYLEGIEEAYGRATGRNC